MAGETVNPTTADGLKKKILVKPVFNPTDLRKYIHFILIGCGLLAFSLPSSGQQEDAALWSGITVNHQVTRRLGVSVNEQIRLDQNISHLLWIFTDAGVGYDLNSGFKASFGYRIAFKNLEEYYATYHRIYLDLSYKYKIKPLVFSVRERIQNQTNRINSSELGKIPEWTARTKFTIKFDLDKKYTPYFATEFAYVIDNAKEKDQVFDKDRFELGMDYEFNKRSEINLFYMIQNDILENKTREFITGIGYSYSF